MYSLSSTSERERAATITTALTFSLLVLSLLATPHMSVNAQTLELNIPYAYTLTPQIPGNLSIVKLLMLNRTAVMSVATDGSRDYVAVLDVSNPYETPKILQLYPLVGRVTSFTTDGWPAARVAIGTDMGEVLLFKISGGRIYKTLESVLGADYYVRKAGVLRTADGGYRIAVLVSEGGPVSGLCSSCYVYVFSEGIPNVLKIGGYPGNATPSYPGIMPQDIVPLTVFTGSSYYYDASKLMVVWATSNFIVLVVNVTQVVEGVSTPASGALVNVVAYDVKTGLRYAYGFNAGQDGRVGIPVPRGMMVNITVQDIYFKPYTLTYNTSKVPGYVSTVGLPPITLPSKPLTTPASALYRTPEFLLANLEVLDVSDAPHGFKRVGYVNFKVPPTGSYVSFLKGVEDSRYVITHYDPEAGYVNVSRVDLTLRRVSLTTEYIGNAGIPFSMTLKDGSLLVLSLSDGRVKAYRLISGVPEHYALEYTYVYGSPVEKVGLFLGDGNPAIFAASRSGLQVIRVEPYVVPIFRRDLTLNFAGLEGGYVDSDLTGDFTAGVVCSGNKLLVLRNIYMLVDKEPLLVSSLTAGRAVIRVIPPGNESASEARVTFKYPGGVLVRTPGADGTVVFDNILPGVRYEVLVNHSRPYVNPNSTYIEVSYFGDVQLEIRLTYKEYKVGLNVSDPITGGLIAPYTVMADGRVLIPSSTSRLAEVTLLYGTHELRIAPAPGYERVYEQYVTTLLVSQDVLLNVTLNRRMYLLEVRVEDEVTTKLIAPVQIEVAGVTGTVDAATPRTFFTLPYGSYLVNVGPASGYEAIYSRSTFNITLSADTARIVRLPRNLYTLYLSLRDATINMLTGTFDVYVNNTRRLTGVTRNATMSLPYGTYVVQVRPTSEYEKVYSPSQALTIKLTNHTSLTAPLARRYYTLRVNVMEGDTPIKGATIKVFSVDTGALVTVLNTAEEGYVEISLFYGTMRLEITAPGYYDEVKTVSLDKNTVVTVYMSPQPITLFFRYLPIAAVVVVAVVAVYGVLRLRSIIYRRLYREESLF
ncbi:MAG: carboxypeptidase-like regulatory domain-containing protein [Zestosphaera sp.]